MITADNITDEQIRSVWTLGGNLVTGRELMDALGEPWPNGERPPPEVIRVARARCAELLNTYALNALFDAALAVKPWDIVLSETYQPGSGDVLIAWAKSRWLDVRERHYVTETDAYANVCVNLGERGERGEATITVLNYRKLTAGEVSAISVGERERSVERIGYGEALL